MTLDVNCEEGDIHDEPEEVEVVFERGLCAPLFQENLFHHLVFQQLIILLDELKKMLAVRDT